MKNLKSKVILGSLLLLIMTSTTVAAIANTSNFTPERPGIPLIDSNGIRHPGFSYPTFNNFTENQNAGASRDNDERKFLVGKHCENADNQDWGDDDETNCKNVGFSNTVPTPSNTTFEENDILRLSLYFHNNGSDRYDNGSNTSPDAENVKIGFDLNNITDPNDDLIIHPRGFIEAANNEYRIDGNEDPLTNGAGDVIRRATDDMIVKLPTSGIEFEIIPESFKLGMAPILDADLNDGVNSETVIYKVNDPNVPLEIELQTFDGKGVTLTAYPTIDVQNNRIWLTFKNLPGCFRYSGFLYVDLKIKKPEVIPPVCLDMSGINVETIEANYLKLWIQDITTDGSAQGTFEFSDRETPSDLMLEWTTDDPTGEFFFMGSLGNKAKLNHKFPIHYRGSGTVTATVFNYEEEEEGACLATLKIPDAPPICQSLDVTVEKNVDIVASRNKEEITTKKGLKLSIDEENYIFSNGQIPDLALIRWTSEDPEGKFYYNPTTGEASGPSIIQPYTDIIYYIGNGPINVSVEGIPAKQILPDCADRIELDAPICRDLKVNHPKEPIQINTLSTFQAAAFDNNGEIFNDTERSVVYWVENGEGVFFSDKPTEPYIENTDMVNEFDLDRPIPGTVLKTIPGSAFGIIREILTTADTENRNNEIGNDILDAIDIMNERVTMDIDYSLDGDENFEDEVQPPGPMPIVPNQRILQNNVFGLPTNTNIGLVSEAAQDFQAGSIVGYNENLIGYNQITARPGETIYFLALRPGTLYVKALNTEVADCERSFKIVGAPICEEIKVNKPSEILAGTVSEFIASSTATDGTTFNESITYSIDEGFGCIYTSRPENIPQNPNQVVNAGASKQFLAPDALKKFYTKDSVTELTYGLLTKSKTSTETNRSKSGISQYLGGNVFNVGPVSTENPVGQSKQVRVRDELDELINEVELNRNNVFTLGQLPERFILPDVVCPLTATVDAGESVWIYATKPSDGVDVIHVDTNNTEVENCSDEYPIVEQITPPLVCIDLSVKSSSVPLEEDDLLEPGKVYRLSAEASYSDENPESTITYTSTEGIFIKASTISGPSSAPIIVIQQNRLELLLENGRLERSTWEQTNSESDLEISQTATIENGAPVFFVTFSDATGENALTVQATGREEEACIKTFGISAPPLDEPCQNIEVTYGSGNDFPSAFDPTKRTLISVREGDFGDYTGGFEFRAEKADGTLASGKFVNGLPLEPENPVVYTQEQSKNVVYDGGEEGDKIIIRATGDAQSIVNCSYIISSEADAVECVDLRILEPSGTWTEDDLTSDDEQRFRIAVTTEPANFVNNLKFKWEIRRGNAEWDRDETDSGDSNPLVNFLREISAASNLRVEIYATDEEGNIFRDSSGNQICVATKDLREEDDDLRPPEIEKTVYDESSRRWRDLTNIGVNDKWITYYLKYETGDYASAEIWESKMNSRGEIQSTRPRDLDGVLVYEAMAIAIEDGRNQKAVFVSDDFDLDYYDDKEIDGDELSNFDNWNRADDEDWVEDNYLCNGDNVNENRDFCIDLDDVSDIENQFGRGQKLPFKNTDKVDNIYIIYQFRNASDIADDPSICDRLDPEDDGCGEEFPNLAEFDSYEDNDFDEEGPSGDDDAKVIVICPFVLARESGDVIFHSAVDTGINVEFCSEKRIKQADAIVLKPIQPVRRVVSTGSEDDKSQNVLSLPSHDLCKLNGGDIADADLKKFSKAFENFSSSICEMEAQVAEQWTEENIVQAITANIDKISRWGKISRAQTLTDMNSVKNAFPNNTQSGVYVVEGANLTIKGINNNEFKIRTNEVIPAGQTYIVKNADLIIESNISYDDSSVRNTGNPSSFPSAAFIVIDGNIKISKNVTEIDGILMAVSTKDNEKGQIMSHDGLTTDNRLIVNGSMIGNVSDIFKNRKASGNILRDEGSITVRYDQRILLNTPPGLSSLIDIAQLRVAN